VAYGARLESVLSESSRGFESPILRHCDESRHKSHLSRDSGHSLKVPGHRPGTFCVLRQ
jgi:hypothetical protein